MKYDSYRKMFVDSKKTSPRKESADISRSTGESGNLKRQFEYLRATGKIGQNTLFEDFIKDEYKKNWLGTGPKAGTVNLSGGRLEVRTR